MVINHNISSIFASNRVNQNNSATLRSTEKLASGQKINRAGDDAANLAVATKMASRIKGLGKAYENTQNGISFIQTASGYLNETVDVLQRIRELAVQARNGTYSDEDRQLVQVEVSQLVTELDRVAGSAQFNGLNILTGRFANTPEGGNPVSFQIGPDMDQNIEVYVASATAASLGIVGEGQDGNLTNLIDLSNTDGANEAIGKLDNALKVANSQIAELGATQNRMETAAKGLSIASENLISSYSTIADTDFASEMVEYTKNQILTQSATAMLANANSNAANVLYLLK